MCQMCDEYEAELRRMGIAVEPAERDKRHATPQPQPTPAPQPAPTDRKA